MINLYIPTQEEITNRVNLDWSKPVVTFLCLTFNHAKYIDDTIKGFLIQKTSFPYEILIHDDCSTDGTIEIINSYKARYPSIIRTIIQKENQYSQGNSVVLISSKEAKADYIAICEGDDYWFSENKVQNQLELMLKDSSIAMIFCPAKIMFDGKITNKILGEYGTKMKFFSAQQVLDIAGQLGPTSSYMVKKNFLISSSELFISAPVGDLFIELYCSVEGKLLYFPEVSSIYRLMAKGSWTENINKDKLKKQLEFIQSMGKTIEYTKTLKGYEHLDWSTKESLFYYLLARTYLEKGRFREYKKTIEESYNYRHLSNNQYIFYKLRNSKILLFILQSILSIKKRIN